MSQTEEARSNQPATARAEDLIDSVGLRIGSFAATTSQRMQGAAASLRQGVDSLNRPLTAEGGSPELPSAAKAEESGSLATQKAEELVDRAGQQVNQYASRIGLQMQRALARLREEAEDILAEAQNIRSQNKRQ
jgi:hypothetical protein